MSAQQHPEIYRETDDGVAATAFLTLRARLACALFDLADHLSEDQVAGVTSSAT